MTLKFRLPSKFRGFPPVTQLDWTAEQRQLYLLMIKIGEDEYDIPTTKIKQSDVNQQQKDDGDDDDKAAC